MSGVSVRIIGIDPGLLRTGWGVVDYKGSKLTHVANGVIKPDAKQEIAQRLAKIRIDLDAVITEFQPDESGVELTFVNKDPLGALKLGFARGVALSCLAYAGISVREYAPNTVKKTVVGSGHADKGKVQNMLTLLLPGVILKNADSADALAVAITCAFHRDNLTEKIRALT